MTHSSNPLFGVNLGGWLVIEKWMTPSLFANTTAQNEYELSQSKEGRAKVGGHHETFITTADIEWLAEAGVQILRIPFGHWIFNDQPPYVGAIEKLDWVIDVAATYGMQVLLDLHGAPEAQNTKMHSGSGNRTRDIRWLDNQDAQNQTIETLVRIAQRYRDRDTIWGIELLNEPSCDMTGLKLAKFYRRAYREITEHARVGTRIIFSDAFSPLLLTNTFGWQARRNYPVMIDCHIYHCFGHANKSRSFAAHLNRALRSNWLIRLLTISQPVIVGEWSNALPYPVSDNQTETFSQTQQYGFRHASATFYWSYKTETGGRWSFREMIMRKQLHKPKR